MVQHGEALTRESGDASLTETVVSGTFDRPPTRMAAACRYAVKLTLQPGRMLETDLHPLREQGLSDRDIVDLNQVAACFNYVNRVTDGLGVELEADWPEEARRERRYPLRARWEAGQV